jgi:hypothetical protein
MMKKHISAYYREVLYTTVLTNPVTEVMNINIDHRLARQFTAFSP